MDLLQLWQNVYREAGQLAEAVERLPDECACGDAGAHLEGRCRCCDIQGRAGGHPGGGENCETMLARLRANLTMLTEDFAVAGPPLEVSALEKQRYELRRDVFLAASDLQQVLEAFKRASESLAGFRRDCAVSRMRAVKRHCAELRDDCERVNAQLLGGGGSAG